MRFLVDFGGSGAGLVECVEKLRGKKKQRVQIPPNLDEKRRSEGGG